MKKLFLLIPALVISMMMSATKTPIDNSSADALRLALYNSTAGDTIVMEAGVYEESNSGYIAWRRSNVVMAKEGANVIIKPHVSFRVRNGARAELIGVKIDASELTSLSGYEDIFQAGDANDGNRLILEGCEIYGNVSKTMLRCASDKKLDSLIINNCYIHDNAQATLRMQSTSLKGVIITNTTIANVANGGSFWCAPMDISSTATDAKVIVDHCTFYHNTSISSSYADITVGYDGSATSDVTVTNCIFAQPASYDGSRAINLVNGGTVRNCLTFNYTKSTNGIQGATVKENCIAVDPLFTDAANGDYSYHGNWVTPSVSPARGAATDGSDLGDPRWYTDEVLPSSNFVAPYAFIGAKAVVRDNMELDGNNYIHSKSAGGSAIWKIHATRAGNVQVTLNMDPDGQVIGHTYHVEVFDANGNSMGEVNEGGWYNNVDDKVLPGTIAFPAEGDYKIVLTNSVSGTKSTIKGITLAYAGGAIVNVPVEELLGTEAVRVDAGHLKVTKLANGDLQYGDNQYPLDEYVYWNINATKLGDMKVTLNVVAPGEGDPSSHEFLVELYSNLNESPISSSAEVSATSGTGARVLPTAINIPATGNYIVKLTNKKQWSSAILHSVEFEYLGGATITVPANELIAEEAVLVDGGHLRVSKLANGDLQYGDNEYPLQEYVYWNINATKYGSMNVTANVVFNTEKDAEHQSSHQFLVELYSDLNETPISSSEEESATSKTGEVHMPALNIPAVGTYIVKLTNKKQWSSAILHSFEFAYAGGEVAEVPGQILGVDAVIFDNGNVKMFHNADGDLEYGDNGTPNGEYAFWNINATAAGEMEVTLNIDPVRESGHNYRIELYDGNVLQDYSEELASTDPEAYVHTIGDVPLTKRLAIPAAGTYTLRVLNRGAHSSSILHGITFTPYVAPTVIVIDEMDEDNSAWIGYKDGDPVNVTLTRTLKAGMYNTFCLPFAVSSTQCKAVFGNDVEIYTLGSAVVDGTVLNVTLDPSDDIYQGTPVFIKPSADVVNPSFEGVSIVKETPASTTKTNANLVGTFVKTTLTGGENILYLGPSNTLYYPEIDTPIKGMRAWFAIHDAPTPAPAIKRMNIVNAPAVVTEINLIDADNKAVKTIENGQLIITIDGVRYNVMGVKIQ